MKPGVTSLPRASISVSPLRVTWPISWILPSATARSASYGAPPEPSTMVPPRMTSVGVLGLPAMRYPP